MLQYKSSDGDWPHRNSVKTAPDDELPYINKHTQKSVFVPAKLCCYIPFKCQQQGLPWQALMQRRTSIVRQYSGVSFVSLPMMVQMLEQVWQASQVTTLGEQHPHFDLFTRSPAQSQLSPAQVNSHSISNLEDLIILSSTLTSRWCMWRSAISPYYDFCCFWCVTCHESQLTIVIHKLQNLGQLYSHESY